MKSPDLFRTFLLLLSPTIPPSKPVVALVAVFAGTTEFQFS